MYFITAPLHIYALITGFQSGFGIRCLNRDKSFWSSFQNKTSLITVKVWAIILILSLSVSIVAGITNFLIMGYHVELLIGLAASILVLSLTYEVVIAMFFPEWMVKFKQSSHKKSCWRVVSRLIFDKHMLITPKHFYVGFWSILFCVCLLEDQEGVFQSALWWPKDTRL